MAGNIFGMDLGSYDIKIYNKDGDSFTTVKDALAIKDRKSVLAVGDTAYEMFEKSPEGIEVVFPMKEGVVSHFYDMQHLMNNIFKNNKQSFRSPNYIISVPTDVSEVEKKAFYDLLTQSVARSKSVSVVERSMADAVGFAIDIDGVDGAFIVNMGDQTTEMSVIASGGIILNKLLKKGGAHMDQHIISGIKGTQEFLIGELTAEKLRKTFGLAHLESQKRVKSSGRNLQQGVPALKELNGDVSYYAIKEVLDEVVQNILSLLDRTPPLILRHIKATGIHICGGVANTVGLKEYLEEMLELSVHISDEPEQNTVRGLSEIINNKELHKLTYSMIHGNYRWMR